LNFAIKKIFLIVFHPKLQILNDFFKDIFEECPFSSTLLDEDDKRVAEQIIDQLFCDSINIDLNDLNFPAVGNNPMEIQTQTTAVQEVDIKEESGYVSSLNMSELEMEDGTKVIFVIAPDSPDDDSASIIEVPSVQVLNFPGERL
jgi:hypothetical protein